MQRCSAQCAQCCLVPNAAQRPCAQPACVCWAPNLCHTVNSAVQLSHTPCPTHDAPSLPQALRMCQVSCMRAPAHVVHWHARPLFMPCPSSLGLSYCHRMLCHLNTTKSTTLPSKFAQMCKARVLLRTRSLHAAGIRCQANEGNTYP